MKTTVCKKCGSSFRVKRLSRKFCGACRIRRRREYGLMWARANPHKRRSYSRKFRERNYERARAAEGKRRIVYNDRTRDRLFKMFGDKCAVCGFADRRALQLDHVNGNGNSYAHNGRKYTYRGIRLYSNVIQGRFPKEDFQLLCANHNWIKRWEHREIRKF